MAQPRAARPTAAPRVLICNPVSGSTGQLNPPDPSRRQGDGRFQTPRTGGWHNGIDIAGPVGTPIHATGDGRVIHSGPGRGGTGNAVVIRHRDGTTTHSYHLRGDGQPAVGTQVRRGETIGILGRTGNVPERADSHLHQETRDLFGRPMDQVLNGQGCEMPRAPRPAPAAGGNRAVPAR